MKSDIENTDTARRAVRFRFPEISDGIRLWEIARDSQVLDLNSSYAYVLWCRDFRESSVVAEVDGRVAGFVTGYFRPPDPLTIMVWQVAVDGDYRGLKIAHNMLDWLLDQPPVQRATHLETTISPDNEASIKLFSSLARSRDTEIVRSDLFPPDLFPDSHEAEDLYRIGEFAPR
ncbi:diaminobutyrate acetyltransferase [Hoyosella sp. G463]|uniref:L-2,4-diaminobutyric acid acetyltransferase n=1 Tax=Lolliginicoccus lacisalsi TaxID=2742202 RepID=A0A927JC28_9ACTN|nr:diaminobutyrate acetyltransferase [Lolliginicoccus lacisalsi]MBD8505662.1 diaminobutyrate acetyltransferase [Lolliginicoccus lacisalsi]